MKILYTLCLSLVFASAFSQITVTNATFPVAGDSLKTATDLSPGGIQITPPGGPYSWDFTSLSADTRLVTVFSAAQEGAAYASYPDADLVVIAAAGVETYYQSSASTFDLLGISGSGLVEGFPIETDLEFTPPMTERYAPLNFIDSHIDESSLFYAISTAEIPDEILDSLGVPTGLLDSVRFRLNITRNTLVDAYGTITIPGGSYEVLREKRTDFSESRIEIHTILGWTDITDLIPIGDFGFDTVITYQFISNVAKEPIAVVTVDSTGLTPVQVDYKDLGVTSAVDTWAYTGESISVYPNPATDEIRFKGLPSELGPFNIQVYNSYGQLALNSILRDVEQSMTIDFLVNGNYVYQILDKDNRILGTGALVIAKP